MRLPQKRKAEWSDWAEGWNFLKIHVITGWSLVSNESGITNSGLISFEFCQSSFTFVGQYYSCSIKIEHYICITPPAGVLLSVSAAGLLQLTDQTSNRNQAQACFKFWHPSAKTCSHFYYFCSTDQHSLAAVLDKLNSIRAERITLPHTPPHTLRQVETHLLVGAVAVDGVCSSRPNGVQSVIHWFPGS